MTGNSMNCPGTWRNESLARDRTTTTDVLAEAEAVLARQVAEQNRMLDEFAARPAALEADGPAWATDLEAINLRMAAPESGRTFAAEAEAAPGPNQPGAGMLPHL